jgi:hypothetical protein
MVSATRLLRALARSAADHGCAPGLALVATRDWASGLFVGMRYDVAVTLDNGPAALGWLHALPHADLPMPHQFANEVRLVAKSAADGQLTATLEALVLQD